MKNMWLVLVVMAGCSCGYIAVDKERSAFADEGLIRTDQPIWVEIALKLAECKGLADKYITIVDTNMIDDVEIILDAKQKIALEGDYDICKNQFKSSVAKF